MDRSTALPVTEGPMVWHGWGDPARRPGLSEHATAVLVDALGPLPAPRRPVAFDRVRLADSRLDEPQRAALVAVVGEPYVRTDRRSRIEHAGGRSYPDLIRRRDGDAVGAPDAVVLPADHDEVLALLRTCTEAGIAVVPFGGGTSVVGGVEPERGGCASLVAVDLARMGRLVEVDQVSRVARFEPGARGVAAEAELRTRGFTLGHFPQSYEYATLGGYVATRSAGQASTGYGRIDDLVVAVRCATPTGELRAGRGVKSAAGPDLVALLVGSEGTLGILTELALQVRPAPEAERFLAQATPSFASGAATVRALVHAGVAPDVVRLSDEDETALTLTEAEGWRPAALRRYLTLRGLARPALLVLGWEGTSRDVTRRMTEARRLLAGRRTVHLGAAPARAWAAQRFDGPYRRDDLLDHGVAVDTLETAAPWSRLGPLYLAVRTAIADTLRRRGTPPLVACHLSHAYPTGASLYFTWLARQEAGAELDQWRAVKRAASDAIVTAGGTITHHHAVGLDHRDWMQAEIGSLGLDALRAVKDRLDPAGILNPGKLLPPA